MMDSIGEYYDKLAATYDQSRFGNSYGRYIDAQERRILKKWLAHTSPEICLDLGCGTGRLLDFSRTGVDGSLMMLGQACKKYSTHTLIQADLTALPFSTGSYHTALSFHVLMHLEPEIIQKTFREVARVVQINGRFIIDIPAKARRDLSSRQQSGWHGNTAATIAEIQQWAKPDWKIRRWEGIVFFPIHRIPSRLRPMFRWFEMVINKTFLSRLASYYVIELERIK